MDKWQKDYAVGCNPSYAGLNPVLSSKTKTKEETMKKFSEFSADINEAKVPGLKALSVAAAKASAVARRTHSSADHAAAHKAHKAAYDAHRAVSDTKPLSNMMFNRMKEHGLDTDHHARLSKKD